MGLEANRAMRFLLQRAGSVYTAGPAAEDALTVCKTLAEEGVASTVCHWSGYLDDPAAVCDAYLYLLRLVQRLRFDCYLSVKATALGFKGDLLKRILAEAARSDTMVHFDSMAPDTVDRTFTLIQEARLIHSNLGCTLPARWRRSLNDADRAVDLGLCVRLVKGQWSGSNGDESDPHEGFLRLVDRLIFTGARHLAVATHNPVVARSTLGLLAGSDKPYELELLHRLPQRRMLKIARQYKVRTRMYVPCGEPSMPYRLREIGRDPRILAWFMRDLIRA